MLNKCKWGSLWKSWVNILTSSTSSTSEGQPYYPVTLCSGLRTEPLGSLLLIHTQQVQAAHHKVKGCYFIEGGSHTDDSDDLRWGGKGIHARNTQGDMDNSALHIHYMYLAARWLTSHRIKSFLRYRASASLCLLLLDRFSSCLHILSKKYWSIC